MTYRYHSLNGVKEYLDIVFEKHKKDWDTVVAIVGKVGVGKSNLALHMLEYWNTKLNGECKESDIKHMCLNRDDFIKDLSDCKKNEMTIYDEAGDISSRGAMTEFNRQLMVAYQIIRADNIFTVLVLPDIWDLDSYFRNKRIKGLFYVPKRGRVAFWGKKKIEKVLNINQYKPIKNYFVVKPDFTDTCPIYKGVMINSYKELKETKVKEYRKNLIENKTKREDKYNEEIKIIVQNLSNEGLPQWKIGEIIGKTQVTVHNILKKNKISNR